jgi:hypothetical protein
MKFLNFFLLLRVIFALLDPDSKYGSGSGSTDLIESGSAKLPFRSWKLSTWRLETCLMAVEPSLRKVLPRSYLQLKLTAAEEVHFLPN